MPETDAPEAKMKGQENCLEISLEVLPSMREVSGREITFTRAILALANTGHTALVGVVPHATFAQERGIVHDATEALSRSGSVESIRPGEAVKWDVYDLLLAAHPGVASKVHLWGYKAVLDWWLDFGARAEYRTPDTSAPQQTRSYQWRLRWSPAKSQADKIDLDVEVVKD